MLTKLTQITKMHNKFNDIIKKIPDDEDKCLDCKEIAEIVNSVKFEEIITGKIRSPIHSIFELLFDNIIKVRFYETDFHI